MRFAIFVLVVAVAGCGGGTVIPTMPDPPVTEDTAMAASPSPSPSPAQPAEARPKPTPKPRPTPAPLCPAGLCLLGYTNAIPPRPICGPCPHS